MRKSIQWMVVPTTLALTLATVGAALGQTALQITPNSQPDPLVATGKTGGSQKSKDCGYISSTPNQVVRLTAPLPYLRFSVASAGSPTLMVKGPGGQFCALADSRSGNNPEISGFWAPGTYEVFVGDRNAGTQNTYTLSITQKPKQ